MKIKSSSTVISLGGSGGGSFNLKRSSSKASYGASGYGSGGRAGAGKGRKNKPAVVPPRRRP